MHNMPICVYKREKNDSLSVCACVCVHFHIYEQSILETIKVMENIGCFQEEELSGGKEEEVGG